MLIFLWGERDRSVERRNELTRIMRVAMAVVAFFVMLFVLVLDVPMIQK